LTDTMTLATSKEVEALNVWKSNSDFVKASSDYQSAFEHKQEKALLLYGSVLWRWVWIEPIGITYGCLPEVNIWAGQRPHNLPFEERGRIGMCQVV